MKKQSNLKITLCVFLLSVLLSLPMYTLAAAGKKGDSSEKKSAPVSHHVETAKHHIESAKQDILKAKQKAVIQEAVDAVKETQTALKALENDKPKEALAALEVVSGKLHLMLSRDPNLGLVPIDLQMQVFDIDEDLKTIKAIEKKVTKLVEKDQFQSARPVIDDLASEIRLTIVNLPIETYPAAIDAIAPLIDAGKIDEAKDALYAVLDTLVITEEVMPLPILRADFLLSEAFRIEHTADLSKEKSREKIDKLINDAGTQIKIAETLGYGDKEDYKPLYESIDALKKTMRGEGFAAELDKMKKALSTFKNKIVHPAG